MTIMAPNTTFESLNFNPFVVNDSLNDNSQDPDSTFFSTMSLHSTQIISPSDFNGKFISGVLTKTLNLFCGTL